MVLPASDSSSSPGGQESALSSTASSARGRSGCCDELAPGSRRVCASGSSSRLESGCPPLDVGRSGDATLPFLPPFGPLDSSEAGLSRFGPLGEGPRCRGRRRSLLERPLPSDAADSVSEAVGCVDGESPRRSERDRGDLVEGVSGTGRISGSSVTVSAGGAGGGLSGPSSPPTFGTPGMSLLIVCTLSSSAMRNWTNVQFGQASRPKITDSLRRSLCSG